MRLALCLFLGLLAASAAPAQREAPFIDTVDVAVVEIDVQVTDRRGRPVRGLKREDFELTVDGWPVEVSNFLEYRLPGVVSGGAGANGGPRVDGREPGGWAAPRVPLTIILYMDDRNTHPAHRARLLARFAETVEPLRRADARFMLAAFDEHVKILVPPTRDLDALLEAAAARPKPRTTESSQVARANAIRDMARSDEDCENNPFCRPCIDNWGDLMAIVRTFARDEAQRAVIATDGLADLATTLAGVAGRKAVVYVSSGLPQQAGVSAFAYLTEQVCPPINSEIMRNSGDASLVSTGFNQASRFNLVSAHANANRVTIFPLDAAGLRAPTGDISLASGRLSQGGRAEPSVQNDSLFASNAQDGLFLLAEETGGKALVNSNDMGELLGEVSGEVSAGYSLGFLLADRRPEQVRQVEVRLAKGAAKGGRVRYRRSFRDKTLEERLAERLLSVAYLGGQENPLGAGLRFAPSESGERNTHGVMVGVVVPENSATLLPSAGGREEGGLRLWLLGVEEEKGIRTTVRQTMARVGGGGVQATAGAYRFEVDVVVPEGAWSFAVGIRDEATGTLSLLRDAVAVPVAPSAPVSAAASSPLAGAREALARPAPLEAGTVPGPVAARAAAPAVPARPAPARAGSTALPLLLAAAQAAVSQPASIDAETNTVLSAARTATSAAELEAARGELLSLAMRFPRDLHPGFPDRSRALVEAAALGRRLGVTNAAAGELLQVLEREPESEWTPRAHLELADVLLDRGDWRLAADHLRQARAGALARNEGVIPGAPNVDGSGVDVARLALERMTRIHRLLLRPLAGRSPWTRSDIHLPPDYLPDPLKLKRPRTIAAGPRGELLAADGDRVVLLGPDRETVASRELRGIERASLVPAGPVGGLAALVATPNSVLRGDAEGPAAAVTFQRPSGGRLDQIVGVHRGPFGRWVVLSRRLDVVLRYDRNGRLLDYSPSTLEQPVDLAPGPGGTVHVLDAGTRSSPPSVLIFRDDWELAGTVTGAWQRPEALAVDAFGNSYVLDRAARRIQVVDREGVELAAIGPVLPGGGVELRNPLDVAVDGMGRVFIAEGRMETVLVVE